MDVDHVVQRCTAMKRLPDITCQHLAGDELSLMAQEIFQQLKLARAEIERQPRARDLTGCDIELQVTEAEAQNVRAGPTQEDAHSRQQLGKCEWLDQVIIGSAVEAHHP